MKLSIIGMSGSGKSYWSKKLQEEKGFKRFCCDDIIEQKLSHELKKFGYSGLHDVGKWMGQPFDPQYVKRSKKYLYFENKATYEIFRAIKHQKNIVIDTTGSVIYMENSILQKLSKLTQIIYLDTPVTVQQEMYRLYLKDPKPVIWGKSFYKVNGESNIESLSRCYPKLLAFRSKRYENITNIRFDYTFSHSQNFSVDEFMEVIKK